MFQAAKISQKILEWSHFSFGTLIPAQKLLFQPKVVTLGEIFLQRSEIEFSIKLWLKNSFSNFKFRTWLECLVPLLNISCSQLNSVYDYWLFTAPWPHLSSTSQTICHNSPHNFHQYVVHCQLLASLPMSSFCFTVVLSKLNTTLTFNLHPSEIAKPELCPGQCVDGDASLYWGVIYYFEMLLLSYIF